MNFESFSVELICNNCNRDMKSSKSAYFCVNCKNKYIIHNNICLIDGKLSNSGYQNQKFSMTTKNHFWYRYRQKQILFELEKLFRNFANVKLLDLGCGDGIIDELRLERFPHAAIVGVDSLSPMMEASGARLTRFKNRIQFQVYDLRTLNQIES